MLLKILKINLYYIYSFTLLFERGLWRSCSSLAIKEYTREAKNKSDVLTLESYKPLCNKYSLNFSNRATTEHAVNVKVTGNSKEPLYL